MQAAALAQQQASPLGASQKPKSTKPKRTKNKAKPNVIHNESSAEEHLVSQGGSGSGSDYHSQH